MPTAARLSTALCLPLLFALTLAPPVQAQIYVDVDASGDNDGSSWADAYTSLQTALANSTGDDEIWVAEGTYVPDQGAGIPDNKPDTSFTITGQKDGLEIYGGFDGTEVTRAQRQPSAHPTVLSGDVDDNDDTTPDGRTLRASAINGSNSNHVLFLDGTTEGPITNSTIIDGVTVTGGQANGDPSSGEAGGGLHCLAEGVGTQCSPTLRNVLFVGNTAVVHGGAIYNGGLDGGTASLRVTNAVFFGNSAELGGAIANSVGFEDATVSPQITNAVFSGNSADQVGGAIYTNATPNSAISEFQVTNTILWGNSASTGDQVYNAGDGATPTFSYSLLEGGLEGISENENSLTNDGGNNLDRPPRFADAANPAGGDGTLTTPDDGLNVCGGSPVLDAGANASIDLSTDITGAPRILDRDGNGTATVNMGAYEAGLPLDGNPLLPPPAPDRLVAEEASQGAQLRWSPVCTADLAEYWIYRDTEPIEGSPSEIDSLASVPASDTSYTDTTAVDGQTYYYRVTAVDSSGSESDFSPEDYAFLYPETVAATVNRSFGTEGLSTDYRLVALPGQVNRPLEETIVGEAGVDWQAYRDDGSESNFLVRFDGSPPFTFRPGNGFWLTSTRRWTYNDAIPTVELQGDSVATIPLRDGWNVISNPIGKDVAWSRVEAENPDTLQAISGFEGTFSPVDTFRSAKAGVAYYFFNHDTTRDSLEIPYPGAPHGSGASTASPPEDPRDASLLALSASWAGTEEAESSTVRIGIEKGAARGLGAEDLVAPPGRFEAISLRIVASAPPASTWPRSERARFLMTERRPPADGGENGHAFALRLRSRAEEPVELAVENLSAVAGREAALIHPSAGTSYDLRAEEPVTVEPDGEATRLRVVIGTKRYVEGKRSEVVPQEVQLTSYPNPVRRQGTIEYALPNAEDVRLVVYDVLGREVAVLANGPKPAGRHEVDLRAERLSSGVYFARLKTAGQTLTRKITVAR